MMVRPCTQCGKCCDGQLRLGCASHDWAIDNGWAHFPAKAHGFTLLYWAEAGLLWDSFDLWVSPRTGDEVQGRCPWLRKLPSSERYKCRIHEVRPPVCQSFPVNAEQAIRFGCPMIELTDIDRPLVDLDRELDAVLGRQTVSEADPPSEPR